MHIAPINITNELIATYCRTLHFEAARTARQVGFSYLTVGDEMAPSTLTAMVTEMTACKLAGTAYPVSHDYNDLSICGRIDPSANSALRFIHDIDHIAHNLGTSTDHEVRLGHILAERMAQHNPALGQLALIDMVGSTIWQATFDRFPTGNELIDLWSL